MGPGLKLDLSPCPQLHDAVLLIAVFRPHATCTCSARAWLFFIASLQISCAMAASHCRRHVKAAMRSGTIRPSISFAPLASPGAGKFDRPGPEKP